MAKHWRFTPHDGSQIQQLSGAMRISPLLAQVFIARGMETAEAAHEFLDSKLTDLHDPELLPGVSQAADMVVAAVDAGRRITIYGDYDVDGMTSTSLLWKCLSLKGANVDYYIPSRLEEGYGLNCDALKQLHEEDADRLVITVDCGISSIKEAALAKEIGLELIITDHHQMAESLPEANCLVHPQLPGGEYPFVDLCGVGVAFKLAWAICKRWGDGNKATPQMRKFLTEAIGLTAIGTVADVVPLLGENRLIVRYGLTRLLETESLGLKALMKIAGLDENRHLESEDIGFGLAPRINAAGRLGQARLAVELLTTDKPDRADQLAVYLDKLNKDRRTVERRILKEAKAQVAEHPEWEDAPALVLGDEDWHPGVIGIVANRVAEHYEKPTIMIAINRETKEGQGSGRSFAGYNLYEGLASCGQHLITHGGHQAAAGMKIDVTQMEAFREKFCDHVGNNHEPAGDDFEVAVDAEVRLADCQFNAVRELDRLGPFGQCNKRPIFVASKVELAGKPRTMGEGGRHLSIRFKQYGASASAIAFGRGEWAAEIEKHGGPISICFTAGINRYQGRESVQLQLKDWKPE